MSYRLFEVVGIELEYMIVDREDFRVRPIADEMLKEVGGGYEMEVELNGIAWSNELALHVLEMKTNGPVATLSGLAGEFGKGISRAHSLLAPRGARLMPTGMHPWMDPEKDLKLWPHEDRRIYNTFHRIFDCRGHGWANLQSMHVNLPFGDDEELGRLHAAIRLVLPILPALAASSPYADGRATGLLDTRLETYRHNADRVPSVVGKVVPERVFTRADYEEKLLGRIYRDLASLDPEGVIRHEWVNARGCIARFDRGALEIRVLDIQETPRADLAIAFAVIEVIRALVEERMGSYESQKEWDEGDLAEVLSGTIREADGAVLGDSAYLRAFGYAGASCTAGELWRHLVSSVVSRAPGYEEWAATLRFLTGRGCLARRMLDAAGEEPGLESLGLLAGELCRCLEEGRLLGEGG